MNKKIMIATRVFLGLVFTIFGLNGFLGFMPPPPISESAQSMMQALMETGYFFPILKIIETVSGVLLLANIFSPFFVIVLAPVIFNILTFHIFLAPTMLIVPILLSVSWIILVTGYWPYYEKIFALKA